MSKGVAARAKDDQSKRLALEAYRFVIFTHNKRKTSARPHTVLAYRGKQDVGGGVERRLARVLNDADNESDGNDLHCDIV